MHVSVVGQFSPWFSFSPSSFYIAHCRSLKYLAKSKIDIKPRIQLSHKVMTSVKEQACNLETGLLND